MDYIDTKNTERINLLWPSITMLLIAHLSPKGWASATSVEQGALVEPLGIKTHIIINYVQVWVQLVENTAFVVKRSANRRTRNKHSWTNELSISASAKIKFIIGQTS